MVVFNLFSISDFKISKRKKIVKKKTYFRSDFTGEQESSSDEDCDEDKQNKKQGVCALNPVSCKYLYYFY